MRNRVSCVSPKIALSIASILAFSTAGAQPPVVVAQGVSATQTTVPPFVYGVDAGVAETDNVRLTETNKVSQTIAVVDADFALKEQSRLLEGDAKGDFSYLDYLQNAYGGQLLGHFDGRLHATLIPNKLTWFVQDNFGQAALDPFQPQVPTNQENVNFLTTGPDLTLNLGPTAFFNLSARYTRTQYQRSPFDSNRVLGSVAFGAYLSARSSISLNVDSERFLFTDTAVNQDFDRSNVFGRYTLNGSRTNLTLDAGATRVTSGENSTTGGLARLTLSRKLSPAATVSITAGHALTDTGTSYGTTQSGAIGTVGTAPAPQTSGSYTNNNVSSAWAYKRGRTNLGVSGSYESDSYLDQPEFDVRRGGGEFRVARQLTRGFQAELLGRLYKTDYINESTLSVVGSPKYDDELIAATLAWRYGRGLEIRLRAEHDARVTTGNDTGYKDNRVALTIGYRPYSTQISVLDPAGY